MNWSNSNIAISVGFLSQLPPSLPEIVFAGRSNVGKSSLINALLGRKSLARTSSSPGKTATINFYDIDKSIYFVDLPGYGYARRSFDERRRWGELIEGYFAAGRDIRLVLSLIDIRHAPAESDMRLLRWLGALGMPYLVAATKLDKLSKAQGEKRLSELRKETLLPENVPIIGFCAVSKKGREELLSAIENAVAVP